MDKVSIIMPCFNDGKYINESIKSVINQTYNNIELIIVDDGSTDEETINILQKINHPKIKLLKTNRVGPSGARNKGIEYSTGKYILPLDSDDIIYNTYIEKAVNIISKNENIGIVYCKAEFFGERDGLWDLPTYSINEMLINNVIFVTALFRKDDWNAIGGFDISFKYGLEDYDFWLGILELEREVVQIQEVLFRYRIKKISRSKSFEVNINNIKDTYSNLYKKHSRLYLNHIDEYTMHLRNYMIDQQFIKNKMMNKIKKNIILGTIIKNNFLKTKIKKLLSKSKV